jgi:nicotinamidase-related amidase
MGCDCREKCEIKAPWKRQIALLDIDEKTDAITDNGQELYNLLAEREIDRVMIMGVHLNMCVLGRPFGIRQLTHMGKEVVLVRDLTDTMYNSEKRPYVDHFSGTDLVVKHVEQHWCPTILSTDLAGGKPFRFSEDRRERK